ncbi:hypothetical protein EGR_04129 [Echinococcus granulosus]|uniref:Uncharacterized protein n=1 Tax=Echinococcus granulosus TaxID=6210 RepID=W6UIV8_ECHGR|nr:hypothetical protein EGR_04129 [Echinococcus granulosus]EUB61096.1 hypothetical protein EGR_04129 [Echinococcus granulosus]
MQWKVITTVMWRWQFIRTKACPFRFITITAVRRSVCLGNFSSFVLVNHSRHLGKNCFGTSIRLNTAPRFWAQRQQSRITILALEPVIYSTKKRCCFVLTQRQAINEHADISPKERFGLPYMVRLKIPSRDPL